MVRVRTLVSAFSPHGARHGWEDSSFLRHCGRSRGRAKTPCPGLDPVWHRPVRERTLADTPSRSPLAGASRGCLSRTPHRPHLSQTPRAAAEAGTVRRDPMRTRQRIPSTGPRRARVQPRWTAWRWRLDKRGAPPAPRPGECCAAQGSTASVSYSQSGSRHDTVGAHPSPTPALDSYERLALAQRSAHVHHSRQAAPQVRSRTAMCFVSATKAPWQLTVQPECGIDDEQSREVRQERIRVV